jgi:hypothetical protein
MRMIVTQIRSIRTAIDLLNSCGPLTLIQLSRLAKHPNPHRLSKYLIENGYAGLLPTYPVKLVPTGRAFEMPELTKTMVDVLDALNRIGPATSAELAKEVGRTRETVDSFLRQGKEMQLCHVSGDRQSEFAKNMRIYVWTAGPGENFVREKRAPAKPKKLRAPSTTVMTSARPDALTQAFFAMRAAA